MASVNSVIKSLGYAVKQTDEVLEAGAKKIDIGNIIKNSVNNVQSNMSNTTKKVAPGFRKQVQKSVKNVSEKQAYQKTAQKAVENLNGQVSRQQVINNTVDRLKNNAREASTQGTANKYQQFVDKVKNNNTGTRTGRAKEQSVGIQTVVNNVIDSRSTLDIPEGNSRKVSEAINNAVDNIKNPPEVPRMPVIDTSMPNGGPQASPIIKNTPIDNTANSGPKYGPRKDSIPNDDGPWQNNFDFSDDGGPRTDSSGGGNGNKNTNSNTNTNSGPEGGNNSGGGNEGPNERRSWKDYANDYFGGIGDTYKGVRDGGNFWDALESAHTNDDGSLRWGRVAGTYAAAAVGARVISGGGLYKDRYGNSNIPGVPFI